MTLLNDKLPLAQSIAQRLQHMIQSGELAAGEKIASQRFLSKQLKVSRASLREALLTLETLGLVRTLPARGTFVVDPEDADGLAPGLWRYENEFRIEEVFQSRVLLESELCRLAALAQNAEMIEQLETAGKQFEQTWSDGDLVAHVSADLRFHRIIAEAGDNRMLTRIYRSVQDLLTESQRQPVPHTQKARMAQSIEEHNRIVTALRSANPDEAFQAMRAHIVNTARCAGVRLN